MRFDKFLFTGIYCNMEILMLVLLYYLSQNADFAESVKPLMSKIKDSEQMLRFLNDLSNFTNTFSTLKTEQPKGNRPESPPKKDEKTPQSPTAGIADEFIQNILDSYLKKKD